MPDKVQSPTMTELHDLAARLRENVWHQARLYKSAWVVLTNTHPDAPSYVAAKKDVDTLTAAVDTALDRLLAYERLVASFEMARRCYVSWRFQHDQYGWDDEDARSIEEATGVPLQKIEWWVTNAEAALAALQAEQEATA